MSPHTHAAALLITLASLAPATFATPVTGKVRTADGNPVPFASVAVRGGNQGTTSNAEGDYRLDLPPGTYVLVCGHVGYERQEVRLTVADKPVTRDFTLRTQTLTLGEVVVKPGGEDPAYAIIRNAIRRREFHRTRVDSWSCDAYVKGLLRLGSYPRSFMGQKVEFEDGDTTARERILYLSETLAKVRYRKPEGQRVDVVSTRVSGRSNAFGLGSPQPVSFYEQNIQLSSALNPRGFVSPIADNALYFYRYRYQGAFTEDGRLVNRIQVIPRRSYEPLFQGYVQIVEDDWNIHSVDLLLTKASQMELLDTLALQQTYAPVRGIPMLQSQTLLPVFRQFGFQASGHFISVFSNYDVEPSFARGRFGRTILKYDTGSNRRPADYWERIRPIPLLPEEQRDYARGDSLERRRQDPAYLDSIDRRQNRLSLNALLLTGQSFSRRRDSIRLAINPLINNIGFNTVEGWMVRIPATLTKDLPGRRSLTLSPVLRHGFGNGRTNLYASLRYRYGSGLARDLRLAGGRRVLQFNEANPVSLFSNTGNTLTFGNNYLKIYEAAYAEATHTAGLGAGLSLQAGLRYQSRHLLQNTDTTTFWGRNPSNRRYTPNLPQEAAAIGMPDHQALLATLSLTWRPGSRYIELPDRTIPVSNGSPVLNLSYTHGIPGTLGSDVDYGRWRLSLRDDIPLALAGTLRYRLATGGFLHASRIQFPDYRHFNGNQVFKAGEYLNTFQLARYYELATRDRLYAEIHAEHDFAGALTNKIPLVRKLNIRLVAGTNALLTRQDGNYVEAFAGLDNILKVIRLDAILARDRDGQTRTGIRIGIRGIDAFFPED